MHRILLFTSSLFSLSLYSQVKAEYLVRHNFVEAIGKRIYLDSNFKYDQDGGFYDKHGGTIRSYSKLIYLPATGDSVTYADINFGIVEVYVNKQNKIKHLIYRKHYSSPDSISLSSKLNEDYTAIANQFSFDNETQPVFGGSFGDDRTWTEAVKWMLNKRYARLTKTYNEVKVNGRFYSSLKFWLW